MSAFNPEMRSKTENLERLISEVEKQGSGAASDQGGSTSSLGKREVRQYIRSVLYVHGQMSSLYRVSQKHPQCLK